ncbi:hypothetical protein QCA50_014101 [Cerrena zonata]|uniref:DUF6534 domain-containing protein n=1 Tax=Cerrena zonata TaxID=2478898 RepID=A0AAW0FM55_9APHY
MMLDDNLQLTSEILAQGFYVHRMWMISKNVPLTVVTVVLFAARIGLVLNCIIDTIKFDTWLELAVVSNFRPSTIASVALTIIHDGMIALTIVYSLRRERSSFRRTQGIVNWLVLYFVNTGAILVALGIVALISVVSDPLNLLFVGLYVVYAKALANAVFGALNARQYLRPKSAEVITFGDPATSRANTGIEACTKHHQMHVRVDRDILVA